jgi:hypothetical protein
LLDRWELSADDSPSASRTARPESEMMEKRVAGETGC